MASTAVLYTPEVLALATELARYRLDDSLPLRTEARSRSCGSTIMLGIALSDGCIARLGLRSQACAIGQASAAIFARHATERPADEIVATAQAVARWVGGEGPLPDWPDLELIAAARDFPGRHGAMMLPWNAVLQLLSTSDHAR